VVSQPADEASARRAVEAKLAAWPPAGDPDDPDDEVVVWKVDEHSRAWVVYVATRRWVRTRELSAMLVGTSPFVVEKASGALHVYGSGPDEWAWFEAWLDSEG
jgi:hypothetical protein